MSSETDTGGPYIAAALLCEVIIEDRQNIVSLIRLYDRLEITGSAQSMPQFDIPVRAFFSFRSGDFKGPENIIIDIRKPSGEVMKPEGKEFPIEFNEPTVNMFLNTVLKTSEPGLYWFDVRFRARLLTRIPLEIVYFQTTRQQLLEPESESDESILVKEKSKPR